LDTAVAAHSRPNPALTELAREVLGAPYSDTQPSDT
jgi:hypothetical protein